jgi:predicted metalloprotease with PDZ domain
MTVTAAAGALDLWMPAWTPGAYELRSWGRNVTPLSAVDGEGRPLRFFRVGPSRFRVEGANGTVRLRYRVYAARLSDDGSHIDGSHALVNGSSLFLAVAGQEKGLHQVRIALPSGWRAATALEEDVAGWQAIGYEQLIDAPIECGRFAEASARAAGRGYRIVVDGAATVPQRLADDVARIAEAEAQLAGAPPYRRYLAIVHLVDEAGRVAALEHAASTSILVPRRSLVDGDRYDELTYVVAHELFHAWNAKRLRPAELVPYDLSRAQPSRALWIAEGLTEYFAHRAMVRAGRWSRADYLRHVGDEATRAVEAERGGTTLEDAAELAWQPPDDGAEDWDSYYARGHLVALALDAAMFAQSGGRHRLDEALRALLAAADAAGGVLPVDTATLARAIDALVPGVGKKALGWARSADEMAQLGEPLAAVGLSLSIARTKPHTVAGFAAERDGGSLRVVAVGEDGPAALAGLRGGDRIVTLDGAPPPVRWPDIVAKKAPGATLVLGVVRGTRALELHLTLAAETDVVCKLTPTAATPAVTRLRESFLAP